MADNTKILTAEQEQQLRQPIDSYVGGIQEQINALRKDGTDRVIDIQSALDSLKRDRIYTAQEKADKQARLRKELEQAKAVEARNKDQIAKLIADAEGYLKAHFDKEYYQAVAASCAEEKVLVRENYQAAVAELEKTHQATMAKLTDAQEIKDEKYVHKNRLFNARNFLLRNGLYLAIAVIFIALCIATPIVKGPKVQLLTMNNVLNILQQASPRMFLALGVAGLILLAGTDLSIGRMVGMGMTAATIIMHKGINTGGVFGHIFDFTGLPVLARVILALLVCIVLCTIFTTIAGFFTAKFKMHPFISTMSTMLVIFGLVTYATKGVSFGGI